MQLPRQIHPGGFKAIREKSEELEAKAIRLGGKHWDAYDQDRQKQNIFLEVFRKTFSVKNSIKACGVEYYTYKNWKANSIYFVETFNDIIDEWHEEIFTSAAQKARGYLIKDEATESGYGEDADGTPIYHGADSNIQRIFLKAMYPDQFAERTKNEHSGPGGTPLQITRRIVDPKETQDG